MTKLEQLERAYSAAEEAHRKATREYESAVWDAEHEVKYRIQDFFRSIHGPEMDRTQSEKSAAYQAMIAERERVALTGKKAPLPLGTKVTREERYGHRRYNARRVYGVVEAITRESQHPDNVRGARFSCAMASIGEFVVRYLNKDGSPSKRYTKEFHNWTPVTTDQAQAV